MGFVHLPQGMSYALLASLPPVNGIYVSIFPVIFYALTGTSKHISIGTFALSSLMIAAAIDKSISSETGLCPFPSEIYPTVESLKVCLNTEIAQTARVQIARKLAMLCGIIQLLMSFFKLGFMTSYLSDFMISGFTCGASFHVLTSQVKYLLGLDEMIPRLTGFNTVFLVFIINSTCQFFHSLCFSLKRAVSLHEPTFTSSKKSTTSTQQPFV